MHQPVSFTGGTYLSAEEIGAVKEEVFQAIKNELNAELQRYEVVDYILESCREELQQKKVEL